MHHQTLALWDFGGSTIDPIVDPFTVQDQADSGPIRDGRAGRVFQDDLNSLVPFDDGIVVHLHGDHLYLLFLGEGQGRGRNRCVVVLPEL